MKLMIRVGEMVFKKKKRGRILRISCKIFSFPCRGTFVEAEHTDRDMMFSKAGINYCGGYIFVKSTSSSDIYIYLKMLKKFNN